MEAGHVTGSGAEWSGGRGRGERQEDSGDPPPKTDALQATPHHSLSSATAIGPAVLGMAQTALAGADVLHGGTDVPVGEVSEEEEEGKLDHWKAATGTGMAWANAAQNKSE